MHCRHCADPGTPALLPEPGCFTGGTLEPDVHPVHRFDHVNFYRGHTLGDVHTQLSDDVTIKEALRNYWLVIKPGIVLGNLISAAGGFFLASKGHINIALMVATLAGISFVVASGCVMNNFIDRKIDREMSRTRGRVLARRLISPQNAICYALLLGVAGIGLIWNATNGLCLALVLSGLAIYVILYSLYLKRRSLYATLIGSLAGAVPPVAAYCAVTNRFDQGAWILLLIFILWQMPHCYAFAIFRFDDYVAAKIPAVPVRLGIRTAKWHIVGYMSAFMVAALMLSFGGYTGYAYLVVTIVLGTCWLCLAWFGFRTASNGRWARRLFVFSFVCMAALSIMMSVDQAVPSYGVHPYSGNRNLALNDVVHNIEHPYEPVVLNINEQEQSISGPSVFKLQ